MLSIEKIIEDVQKIAKEYPVKKITLFGSYADGTSNEDSDVDLLVEFNIPRVSLLVLSGLRLRLQEELGKQVDLIHAPLNDDTMLEIGKEISLYES